MRQSPDYAKTLKTRPLPGDEVQIVLQGRLSGPYAVLDLEGRTDDHLVMRTRDGVIFEHYWDEFSTWPYEPVCECAYVPGDSTHEFHCPVREDY